MSAQHTPGPWRINLDCETMISNCLDGAEAADICEVSEWSQVFWEERNANARLIAAAPELLEALEGLLAFYHRVEGKEPKAHTPWGRAAEALSKARGVRA